MKTNKLTAIHETTDWSDWEHKGRAPNHTYLMRGDKAVAYLKYGEGDPIKFASPFRLIKTRRTFEAVDIQIVLDK